MAQFKLSVVTPTGSVLDADVSEATVPGAAGEFGMYADHQPALIMLGGGLLSYGAPKSRVRYSSEAALQKSALTRS